MSDEKKIFRFHNELAGGAYEKVVQAGVVHGGIHVNQTMGDSPSALENPVIVTVHQKAGARLAVDADPPRVMVPSGGTYIVTLEAWTARAVVLRAARVVVLSRRIPRPACREGFVGARPSVRHFETNLDRLVEPAHLPGFDANSPRLDPVGPDFPFTISATDVEQFRFTAHADAEEVCWQVELDWICAGREGTVVINDNGRPFETYPVRALDAAPGSWALRQRCDGHFGHDPSCPWNHRSDSSALTAADWAQSIGIQEIYDSVLELDAKMQAPEPDDPANWPVYDRLAAHVRTLLGQPGFNSRESEPFRALLVRVIRYFHVSQQGWIGARIAGPVHSEWEPHLGENHADSLALANRLAACFYDERDFNEARVRWAGLLPRFQRVLGPAHADTLTVTSNLAMALGSDGELAAAENFAGAALAMSRKKLGDDHLITRRAQGVVRHLAALRENVDLFAEVSSVLKSGSETNYNEDDYTVRNRDTWVTLNLTKTLYNPNEPERRRLQAIAEQLDTKLSAAGFALTHVPDHAEGSLDLLAAGITGLAVIRKSQ